jgi:hypothetical protein
MRYRKGSYDYSFNMEAFHDMDRTVPMTKPERDALRSWVKAGHDIDSNPWGYKDSDQFPMNYIQAYRLKLGYSYGPWDYWKGPDPDANFGWHIEMKPAEKNR